MSERAPTNERIGVLAGVLSCITFAALLLGEPLGLSLVLGVAAVFADIWIAATEGRTRTAPAT
jgi:hypothetical protein